MLIKRDVLSTAVLAVTRDDTRYQLHNLEIRPDGTTTATNGHILISVRDTAAPPDTDYPTKGLPDYAGNPEGPVLLDAGVAAKMIQALPKKARVPVLQYAQVGRDSTGVYAATTDLVTAAVVRLDNKGLFPAWERRIPPADPDAILVILSAALLQTLAKAAIAAGNGLSAAAVPIRFEIRTRPEDRFTATDGQTGGYSSAIRATFGKGGIEAVAVIMPMRV